MAKCGTVHNGYLNCRFVDNVHINLPVVRILQVTLAFRLLSCVSLSRPVSLQGVDTCQQFLSVVVEGLQIPRTKTDTERPGVRNDAVMRHFCILS